MARRWRCVKAPDTFSMFTVGKIYTESEDRTITGDDGFVYRKFGCVSAIAWLHRNVGASYKFEEVKDMFTKADLQQFDVVRTSSGRYYVFLSGGPYSREGTFVRVMSDECGFMRPNEYNDDLTFHSPYFSIDEVLRPVFRSAAPLTKEVLYNPVLYKQVFDRKAIPPAKELTVAEIEKLLGYSVKIVKEV